MIIGFDLSQISVERSSSVRGKVKIDNTLDLLRVETSQFASLGPGKQAVSIAFSFGVTYGPNIGKIRLHGTVTYLAESKKAEALAEQWKKTKQLPQDVSMAVVNTILMKCNVRVLQLAQDVGLPPQLQLPSVSAPQ